MINNTALEPPFVILVKVFHFFSSFIAVSYVTRINADWCAGAPAEIHPQRNISSVQQHIKSTLTKRNQWKVLNKWRRTDEWRGAVGPERSWWTHGRRYGKKKRFSSSSSFQVMAFTIPVSAGSWIARLEIWSILCAAFRWEIDSLQLVYGDLIGSGCSLQTPPPPRVSNWLFIWKTCHLADIT